MKKFAVIAFAALFALCLTACGSSASKSASSTTESSSASSSASSESASSVDKFDGSKFSDTGDGVLFLRGPGGDNKDGSVLQVAIKKTTSATQISIDYENGNGSIGTVYVDGIENMKMNAGESIDSVITLQGDAITAGTHTVEFVQMEGDTPTIYKKTQYEIVI